MGSLILCSPTCAFFLYLSLLNSSQDSREPIVLTAYVSQIGGMQRGGEHRSQLEERHGKVEFAKVSRLTYRSCERLQKLDIELPKHI